MTFRIAVESDWEAIKELLVENELDAPPEVGTGIVAEEDGKIIGYLHVSLRLFADPLALRGNVFKRMKAFNGMAEFVKMAMSASGKDNVYFATAREGFADFMHKKYNVEKLAQGATYKGRK